MSVLLIEIWDKIVVQLDCQSILNIRLVSSNFKNYSNLYIEKKMIGFPRATKKCKQHRLNLDIKIFSYVNNDKKICDSLANIIFSAGLDLVRGDIINFNSLEVIFDGHQLLNLRFMLPRKFRVIEYNIPITYWERYSCTEGKVVWFDQTLVKNEILKNIRLDFNKILTSFEYNNEKYLIEFIPSEVDIKPKDTFKKHLEKFDLLMLLCLGCDNCMYLCELFNYYD